jgi:hypothetical protein
MVEGYCCCVVDRHDSLISIYFLLDCGMKCQSVSCFQYLLYSQLMWHGRTQCVYRTSYERSYVKTVAALCGVNWSLQNCSRRRWVWCNKAGAVLSTWVLFANVCCLPGAPFYPESLESRRSLWTTSMIRSAIGTGQDTTVHMICVCVCVHACARVQKGSILCDWVRFCAYYCVCVCVRAEGQYWV